MTRRFYLSAASIIVSFLVSAAPMAGEALGASVQQTIFNIRSSGYIEVSNLEFAVLDDMGAEAWLSPAGSDYGNFGLYTVNNDPRDPSIAGTPGGKMSTIPDDGGPYNEPGPHYVGPHPVTPTTTYLAGSGVGPEFLNNWVGFRFGSFDRSVVGVRFDVIGSYNPDELRLELWTVDWAVDPNAPVMHESLVRVVDGNSTQGIHYELAFAGYNCADIRFLVGPPTVVPEPSGLLVIVPGAAALALRLRRFL